MNSPVSTANKEKVGNIMVYLAERIKPLYHTKLIKLLYFIDEYAVKDNGIPITWLSYNVWEKGPVAPETYFIKNDEDNSMFSDFIKTKKQGDSYIIHPIKSFDDNLFSEYEIAILDKVINDLGSKKANELIQLSHSAGSLWDKAVKKYNITFTDSMKISNYSIELSDLIKDDELKFYNFQEAKDMKLFSLSTSSAKHDQSCMR